LSIFQTGSSKIWRGDPLCKTRLSWARLDRPSKAKVIYRLFFSRSRTNYLREHLYGAHHSVFQCQRCKIVLKSQSDLDEHSEATETCHSRTRKLEDGFNLDTFLFFHNKRKTSRGQTEADRWKEIFVRLFPDFPVPSPCKFLPSRTSSTCSHQLKS
jgi:hypothetical protein